MTNQAKAVSPSADKVVDRIVDQNNALWEFLKSDSQPRDERMALLRRAFPGAKSLQDRIDAHMADTHEAYLSRAAGDVLSRDEWIVATGARIAQLRKESRQ